MKNQAYLFEILTYPIATTFDEIQIYKHKGFYKSGDYIFAAYLDLDPYDPNPSLFGDIATIHVDCTIKTTLPVRISFHAVLKSKNIKQDSDIESFPSQILAFESQIKKLESSFSQLLNHHPNSWSANLALQRITESEKPLSQMIICSDMPYSSYFYNKERQQYMYKENHVNVNQQNQTRVD